jgi:hypothetical protein
MTDPSFYYAVFKKLQAVCFTVQWRLDLQLCTAKASRISAA